MEIVVPEEWKEFLVVVEKLVMQILRCLTRMWKITACIDWKRMTSHIIEDDSQPLYY